MQANRTANSTDTRYLSVTREEALYLADATLDTAKAKGLMIAFRSVTPMTADAWHVGRIEWSDGQEAYCALHVAIDHCGDASATIWPQPRGLAPTWHIGYASSLREAAAICASMLEVCGCYLVHQARTTARDLVTY